MIALAVTAGIWLVIDVLAARWIAAERAHARRAYEGWRSEEARRARLGLAWIEMHAEEGVQVLDVDGDRATTRAVTLRLWHRDERVSLRAGVRAIGRSVPREPLTAIGDVCVLARWPARPEGYREDAGPIALEPDPEHGYRFGRDDRRDPPRGAIRYATFFAIGGALVILSAIPYLRWLATGLTIAYLLAEIAFFARTRVLGAITFSLLALLGDSSDERASARAERAREEDAWD